jgi:hypothetical protein
MDDVCSFFGGADFRKLVVILLRIRRRRSASKQSLTVCGDGKMMDGGEMWDEVVNN